MDKKVVKWHGRDIECNLSKIDKKFACSVSIKIDDVEYCGTTLVSGKNSFISGYYRFDTADAALDFAIQSMEKDMEYTASIAYLENGQRIAKNLISQYEKKHKVSKWLMKLIK